MRFAAGHEIAALHFGTWGLGWLVRLRLMPSLDKLAAPLLRLALLFDPLGSARSAFHMIMEGIGHDGARKRIGLVIEALSGHGPYIPCMPAILLAKRLASGTLTRTGAMPCLDLIALPDYLAALGPFDIKVTVEGGDDE